jgi:hypothetical protein
MQGNAAKRSPERRVGEKSGPGALLGMQYCGPGRVTMVLQLLFVLLALWSNHHKAAAQTSSQSVSSEWSDYNQRLSQLSVGGQTMESRLGPVLTHNFTTPLASVQRANAYKGGGTRMRRLVNSLTTSQPVKVVAIGGIATNGSAASLAGSNDYVALFAGYLTKAFPKSKIEVVRESAGIAPSSVVAACIDRYMPSDADLVLLEMTANDAVMLEDSISGAQSPQAYEALVRKVLSGSKQPALLLTQVSSKLGGPACTLGLAPLLVQTPEGFLPCLVLPFSAFLQHVFAASKLQFMHYRISTEHTVKSTHLPSQHSWNEHKHSLQTGLGLYLWAKGGQGCCSCFSWLVYTICAIVWSLANPHASYSKPSSCAAKVT